MFSWARRPLGAVTLWLNGNVAKSWQEFRNPGKDPPGPVVGRGLLFSCPSCVPDRFLRRSRSTALLRSSPSLAACNVAKSWQEFRNSGKDPPGPVVGRGLLFSCPSCVPDRFLRRSRSTALLRFEPVSRSAREDQVLLLRVLCYYPSSLCVRCSRVWLFSRRWQRRSRRTRIHIVLFG